MRQPVVEGEAFAILLSGPAEPTAALKAAVGARRVVAADGGIRHAAELGLVPELWIGDFDSSPEELYAIAPDAERLILPREKDKTDGEAAVDAAIERGARDLLLVGALRGPRSDHPFSNLVLMMRHAEAGLRVEAFDGRERALPLGPKERRLDLAPGAPFSILRFGDVEGLTVKGARWPLERVALPFSSILTQSNEALGPVEISVEKGQALVIAQTAEA